MPFFLQATRGAIDTIVRRLRAILAPTDTDRIAISKMKGLQTLLYTYCPLLFLLGYGVRTCTWCPETPSRVTGWGKSKTQWSGKEELDWRFTSDPFLLCASPHYP